MGELTARQASEYAKGRGRSLSTSYLVRAVKSGRIAGRAVDLPTGVRYWVIDEASLVAYLASGRRPGGKRRQGPAEAEPEAGPCLSAMGRANDY